MKNHYFPLEYWGNHDKKEATIRFKKTKQTRDCLGRFVKSNIGDSIDGIVSSYKTNYKLSRTSQFYPIKKDETFVFFLIWFIVFSSVFGIYFAVIETILSVSILGCMFLIVEFSKAEDYLKKVIGTELYFPIEIIGYIIGLIYVGTIFLVRTLRNQIPSNNLGIPGKIVW